MVNTFLTDPDFSKSAQNLDNKRLGKQRVEAYQILNLVCSLHIIALNFKEKIPDDPNQYRSWIRDIVKRYKQLGYYLFYHQGEIVALDKSSSLFRPTVKNNVQVLDNGDILIDENIWEKYSVFLPGDLLIDRLGFVYHPAVAMWLNHPAALMHYINCHIDEWLNRGFQNQMVSYQIDFDFDRPDWTFDPYLINNHKAALYTKEIARNEKRWYQNFPDFEECYLTVKQIYPKNKGVKGDFQYYYWPYNSS